MYVDPSQNRSFPILITSPLLSESSEVKYLPEASSEFLDKYEFSLKGKDSINWKKLQNTWPLVQLPCPISWHPATQCLPGLSRFLWGIEVGITPIILTIMKLFAEIEVVDSPAVICYLANKGSQFQEYLSMAEAFSFTSSLLSSPYPVFPKLCQRHLHHKITASLWGLATIPSFLSWQWFLQPLSLSWKGVHVLKRCA